MRDSILDAYTRPRRIRSGCQHQLGCGCDVPYWLRESLPYEQLREAHSGRVSKNLSGTQKEKDST